MRVPQFVKNVATLSVGSISASAIRLASIPIISRLFTPADFGAAALFLSIVAVLAVVAALRYEHAVILADKKSEATKVAILSLFVLAISVLIVSVVAVAAYLLAPDLIWVETLGMWCLLIPVGVCLLSISNVAVSLNTWLKNYRYIALAETSQAGILSISRIGFGFFRGSTTAGLIAGLLLGYATRAYVLVRGLRHQISFRSEDISREQLIHLAMRYKQFPKYSMPTGLLRSVGQNMPVFFLAYMFLPATVGSYAMAARLMQFPIALIGESVRRTYLQKAAEINNMGLMLMPSLIKTTVGLAAIGLFIFFPLLIWGPDLFAIVLGPQWGEAGRYVAILTPWFFSTFVQLPSSVSFIVSQRQDQLFRVHAVLTLLMALAFMVAHRFAASPEYTLMALSALGTAANILILCQGFRLAGRHVGSSN